MLNLHTFRRRGQGKGGKILTREHNRQNGIVAVGGIGSLASRDTSAVSEIPV